MDIEQKLGIKVFYYYLSKKVVAGLVLFIVFLILSSLKNIMVSKIVFILPVNAAVAIVNDFISGLFVIAILVLVGGFFMSWMDYISCAFTLGDGSFNIRRGIFNKKEVSIPYRQIQSVDIEQTFYHKMMGVSKLVVLTAGNDEGDKEGESEGIFEVIDSQVAEKMRGDILQRTNVQTVKEMNS